MPGSQVGQRLPIRPYYSTRVIQHSITWPDGPRSPQTIRRTTHGTGGAMLSIYQLLPRPTVHTSSMPVKRCGLLQGDEDDCGGKHFLRATEAGCAACLVEIGTALFSSSSRARTMASELMAHCLKGGSSGSNSTDLSLSASCNTPMGRVQMTAWAVSTDGSPLALRTCTCTPASAGISTFVTTVPRRTSFRGVLPGGWTMRGMKKGSVRAARVRATIGFQAAGIRDASLKPSKRLLRDDRKSDVCVAFTRSVSNPPQQEPQWDRRKPSCRSYSWLHIPGPPFSYRVLAICLYPPTTNSWSPE